MPNKLYVGNLPWSVNNEGLENLFAVYGDVTEAKVIMDRETGRSRGFGFVTFAQDEDAEKALEMDSKEHEGRALRVNFAQSRNDDRGGFNRGYR